MSRRPPRSTRTDTLFPDTRRFRSGRQRGRRGRRPGGLDRRGDDEQVVARRDALWLSVVDPFARHLCRARHLRPDHLYRSCEGSRHRPDRRLARSEEHTSELQSLMRISYAVFCLKKKKNPEFHTTSYTHNTTKT